MWIWLDGGSVNPFGLSLLWKIRLIESGKGFGRKIKKVAKLVLKKKQKGCRKVYWAERLGRKLRTEEGKVGRRGDLRVLLLQWKPDDDNAAAVSVSQRQPSPASHHLPPCECLQKCLQQPCTGQHKARSDGVASASLVEMTPITAERLEPVRGAALC